MRAAHGLIGLLSDMECAFSCFGKLFSQLQRRWRQNSEPQSGHFEIIRPRGVQVQSCHNGGGWYSFLLTLRIPPMDVKCVCMEPFIYILQLQAECIQALKWYSCILGTVGPSSFSTLPNQTSGKIAGCSSGGGGVLRGFQEVYNSDESNSGRAGKVLTFPLSLSAVHDKHYF